MQLQAPVDHPRRAFRHKELDARRVGGAELARVVRLERAVDERLHGRHLRGAVGQLKLRVLEGGERPAEGRAFLHVRRGEAHRRVGLGVGQEGDAQPLPGQVGGEVRERPALLAQPVGHRHPHVGEGQLRRVGGVQAQLVQGAADGVPLAAGVHDEDGDAAAPVARLRRSGAGADQHAVRLGAAGDEGLGAVEDVVAAVLGQAGGGGHAGEVGSGAGLGHGDGGHQFAGDGRRQPAPLLLLGAVREQVRQAERGVDAGAAEGDAGAAQLFGEDGVEPEARLARTAVLLGDLDAEDAEFAEPLVERARDVSLLLPVVVDGDDLLGDELADHPPERLVVRG
jgi:hypothetical protein